MAGNYHKQGWVRLKSELGALPSDSLKKPFIISDHVCVNS